MAGVWAVGLVIASVVLGVFSLWRELTPADERFVLEVGGVLLFLAAVIVAVALFVVY